MFQSQFDNNGSDHDSDSFDSRQRENQVGDDVTQTQVDPQQSDAETYYDLCQVCLSASRAAVAVVPCFNICDVPG